MLFAAARAEREEFADEGSFGADDEDHRDGDSQFMPERGVPQSWDVVQDVRARSDVWIYEAGPRQPAT